MQKLHIWSMDPVHPTVSNTVCSETVITEEDEELDNVAEDLKAEENLEQLKQETCDWMSLDLQHLLENDIKGQLEAILGETVADSFLHPTMKDHATKVTDKNTIRNYHTLDAQELWRMLRGNSGKKLEAETVGDISYDFQCTSESSRRAQRKQSAGEAEKQKIELMHKIALVNQDKTRHLLNAVQLDRPSGTSPQDCGPLRFCSDSKVNDESLATKTLPSFSKGSSCNTAAHTRIDASCSQDSSSQSAFLTSNCRSASTAVQKPHDIRQSPTSVKELESSFRLGNTTFSFVNEKKCTVRGKFKERLKNIGLEPNVGISLTQLQLQSNSSGKTFNDADKFHKPALKSKSLNDAAKVKRKVKPAHPTKTVHNPLTLNALSEYCQTMELPKSRGSLHGHQKYWSPTGS